MSRFADQLNELVRKSDGSTLTRQARQATVGAFSKFLAAQRLTPKDVSQAKPRLVLRWVEAMRAEGVSLRTMQNRMAHLRTLFPETMRGFDNKRLGIDGASREGTKVAMTGDRFRELVANVRDPGVRACLYLERGLGLRGQEAVQSVRWLDKWAADIAAGRPIRVSEGTKGGRPRDVYLHDPKTALWAIRKAQEAAAARGGTLIDAPTLKAAMKAYGNAAHRAGFVGAEAPHSLRYAWACDRIAAYVAEGYTQWQAAILTSQDLGHGDGRGRYVERVYSRR